MSALGHVFASLLLREERLSRTLMLIALACSFCDFRQSAEPSAHVTESHAESVWGDSSRPDGSVQMGPGLLSV